MKTKIASSRQLLTRVYRNPRYGGKHIIIIGGKIHATKTGQASSELLERLLEKYPEEEPLITYIPAEDTLILFL